MLHDEENIMASLNIIKELWQILLLFNFFLIFDEFQKGLKTRMNLSQTRESPQKMSKIYSKGEQKNKICVEFAGL